MDITKWKSCAVDIDTYCLLRAMGSHGFRKPASMIAKIVDDEVKKISKKMARHMIKPERVYYLKERNS